MDQQKCSITGGWYLDYVFGGGGPGGPWWIAEFDALFKHGAMRLSTFARLLALAPVFDRRVDGCAGAVWRSAMSEVNQHYLPQFLMRGFATKGGTDRSPIFKAIEHHKSRGVMPPRNIKSIGAQRNFYGKEGPGTIDDAIDRYENLLAPLIHQLNLGAQIMENDVTQIASLVAHLITRAKHMRTVLREAFREGGDLIRRYARDGRIFERFAERISDAELERLIRDEAPKYGVVLPTGPIEAIKAHLRAEMKRRRSDPSLRKELSEFLEAVADGFHKEAEARSEQIHMRVLGERSTPQLELRNSGS